MCVWFNRKKLKKIVLSIDSLQMNICQHFRVVAYGPIVQIHTLNVDRPYPILYARRTSTQFGPTVLLTLHTEENINVKVYLPRRYAEGLNDQDIEDINEGKKKYKLVYKGRSGVAYILNMIL